MNILLLEDDSFLQQLYKDLLTQEGYTVEAVSKGKDALDKIKNKHWDLILLDVMVPDITGFAIARTIRKDPLYKISCPLIFLTNLDAADQLNEAKKLGDGYLVKSNLNPEEFIKAIKGYLKK